MIKFFKTLFFACLFIGVQALADTSFVTINSDDWTEISTPGNQAFITNNSVSQVRYVEAETKPAANITTGHLLNPNKQLVYSVAPSKKIFARTVSGIGSIAVSPGSTFSTGGGGEGAARITGPLTSFGEVLTAQPFPITQITAPYGLLEKTESITVLGGSTRAEDSLFIASSGTNSNGLGALLTRRQIQYRAGQGLLSRFTAIFDIGVADNDQAAGLIINTEQIGFGYQGAVFGIVYQHTGESEIQELTITTPAGGSENATVTVNGTGFTVPLTVGTVQHNAFEVAVSLTAQVSDYDFSSNNDQVVARSLLAISGTTFAFTSSTAVAAWAEIQDGADPISSFVPQADWNVSTRPDLDPQKGNVYQIQMQYLGFGGIEFFVEDSKTAELMLTHRIQFANTSTSVSVGNPTFRVGWISKNRGNTTNIEIKGGSASGFIEGPAIRTESPRAVEDTNTSVPVGTFQNIFTLRNRLVFGTRRNRVEFFGLSLSAATDSTKAAIIQVCLDSVLTGDLDFQYIDKANSIVEVARDEAAVTCGRLVSSFIIPAASGVVVNLEELASLLLPGEILTVSASITAGASSSVNASLIWQEDL